MTEKQGVYPDIYRFGPFHLHATRRILKRDGDSVAVDLAPKEFELLHELVAEAWKNPREKLTSEELAKRFWPEDFNPSTGQFRDHIYDPSSKLRTHIYQLRKKLKSPGTIVGTKEGYVLASSVEDGTPNRSAGTKLPEKPLFGFSGQGADPTRPPYVGPQPFPPERAHQFFGRESECNALIERLTDGQRRVTLLYSPSGAGKTSLIGTALRIGLTKRNFRVLPIARIGVLPAGVLPDGVLPDGVLPDRLPESQNFYTLAAIASMGVTGIESEAVRVLPAASTWTGYLSPQVDPDAQGLVLIVDQLEEIITTPPLGPPNHKREFFLQLRDALDKCPSLRILVAFREEYLSELERLASDLSPYWTSFSLDKLTCAAARDAIIGPAGTDGVTFDPQVVDDLVYELARVRYVDALGQLYDEPGDLVEPLQLQVVCDALWMRLSPHVKRVSWREIDRAMPRDPHRDSHGNGIVHARDTIADFVASVLRGFCGDAIEEVAAGERFPVALIDLGCQQFISKRGIRLFVHQDAEYTGTLPNRIVEALARRHLFRIEERRGEPWYELAHDTLIEPIGVRAGQVDVTCLQDLCLQAIRKVAISERAKAEHIDEGTLTIGCCLDFVDGSGSSLRVSAHSLGRGGVRLPVWALQMLSDTGMVRRIAEGRHLAFELSHPRLALALHQMRFGIDSHHLRTLTEVSACSDKCRLANGGSLDGWFENYDSVLKDAEEVPGLATLLATNEAEFILRASLASEDRSRRERWVFGLEIGRRFPQLAVAAIKDATLATEANTRSNAARAMALFSMDDRQSMLFRLAMNDPATAVRAAAADSLAAIDDAATQADLSRCLYGAATTGRALAVCAWMHEAALASSTARNFDAWWVRLPVLWRMRITKKLAFLRLQAAATRIVFACVVATIANIAVTMTARAFLASGDLTLTQAPDAGFVFGWFHGLFGSLAEGGVISAGLSCWWFVVEGCRPWRVKLPGLRSAVAGAAAGFLGGVVNTFAILYAQRPPSLYGAGWIASETSSRWTAFTVTGLGYSMVWLGTSVGLGCGLTTIRILLSPKWKAFVAGNPKPASLAEAARVFGAIFRHVAILGGWSVFLPVIAAALAFYTFLAIWYKSPGFLRILGESVTFTCGGIGVVAGLLFGLYILGKGIDIPDQQRFSLLPRENKLAEAGYSNLTAD